MYAPFESHSNGSNQFVSLLGATYTAGFYLSGRYGPAPLISCLTPTTF